MPTWSTGSGCTDSGGAARRAAQLRTAYEMLEAMRMEAFAERARPELRASGETVR